MYKCNLSYASLFFQSLLLDERPTGLCVDQQKTISTLGNNEDKPTDGTARNGKIVLTTVGLLASHEEPIIYTWIKCT